MILYFLSVKYQDPEDYLYKEFPLQTSTQSMIWFNKPLGEYQGKACLKPSYSSSSSIPQTESNYKYFTFSNEAKTQTIILPKLPNALNEYTQFEFYQPYDPYNPSPYPSYSGSSSQPYDSVEKWYLPEEICPYSNSVYMPFISSAKVTIESKDKAGCLFYPYGFDYALKQEFYIWNTGNKDINITTSTSAPAAREVLPAGLSRTGTVTDSVSIVFIFPPNSKFEVAHKNSIYSHSSLKFTSQCEITPAEYCTYNSNLNKFECSQIQHDFSIQFDCSYNYTLHIYLGQIIAGIIIGLLLIVSIVFVCIRRRANKVRLQQLEKQEQNAPAA